MLFLNDFKGHGHRLLAAAVSAPIDDAVSPTAATDAATDAADAGDVKAAAAAGGAGGAVPHAPALATATGPDAVRARKALAYAAEVTAPLHVPYAGVDVRLCDFDDVLYRVCVGTGRGDGGPGRDPVTHAPLDFDPPNAAHTLRVHMSAPFMAAARDEGALQALRDVYGAMLSPVAAPGADVTVCVDLRTLRGATAAVKDALILRIAQLKCTAIGGVFTRFFDALSASAAAANTPTNAVDGKAEAKAAAAVAGATTILSCAGGGGVVKPFAFPIRNDTMVWFVPEQLPGSSAAKNGDPKVHVTFSVTFRDRVDRAVALTFLREFVECEHMANVLLKGGKKSGSRPKFAFTKLPPLQVADAFGLHGSNTPKGVLGYASFTVLPEHVLTREKRVKLATQLQGFRTFLQYHVKCSKALFHAQMRARASHMLVGVKRAKREPAPGTGQARTITGRYFQRRDGAGGGGADDGAVAVAAPVAAAAAAAGGVSAAAAAGAAAAPAVIAAA